MGLFAFRALSHRALVDLATVNSIIPLPPCSSSNWYFWLQSGWGGTFCHPCSNLWQRGTNLRQPRPPEFVSQSLQATNSQAERQSSRQNILQRGSCLHELCLGKYSTCCPHSSRAKYRTKAKSLQEASVTPWLFAQSCRKIPQSDYRLIFPGASPAGSRGNILPGLYSMYQIKLPWQGLSWNL